MKKTKGLIEQHIHGAFGIDFMNCSAKEMVICAELLAQNGVAAFFPTIMTNCLEKIKERIELVKEASSLLNEKSSKIIGVHLEGPFINPNKSGIHDKKYILPPNIEHYKKIEDKIIRIITIAPELDDDGSFIKYLKEKRIKISAGHTEANELQSVNQVTHLYNAMLPFHHRNNSTVVSALSNENVYVEIIGDSMHVSDEVLRITFRQKSLDKIILISDALPLAHSDIKEARFAGQIIYNENGKLVNKAGTMAGSSSLLCDIIKNLSDKNILSFENAIKCASSNIEQYHNIPNTMNIYWTDNYKIQKVEFN